MKCIKSSGFQCFQPRSRGHRRAQPFDCDAAWAGARTSTDAPRQGVTPPGRVHRQDANGQSVSPQRRARQQQHQGIDHSSQIALQLRFALAACPLFWYPRELAGAAGGGGQPAPPTSRRPTCKCNCKPRHSTELCSCCSRRRPCSQTPVAVGDATATFFPGGADRHHARQSP